MNSLNLCKLLNQTTLSNEVLARPYGRFFYQALVLSPKYRPLGLASTTMLYL
jgi:hypothetical protein